MPTHPLPQIFSVPFTMLVITTFTLAITREPTILACCSSQHFVMMTCWFTLCWPAECWRPLSHILAINFSEINWVLYHVPCIFYLILISSTSLDELCLQDFTVQRWPKSEKIPAARHIPCRLAWHLHIHGSNTFYWSIVTWS